jgi:UDP-N-acetyl-D-glucosamine dehydrogenase
MPYHCVEKAQRALNRAGMSVKGARVGLLGVSYKPGVGDTRESPALKIIELLKGLGADVSYHDPHVASLSEFALQSTSLDHAVSETDLTLIVTTHPGIDYDEVVRRARLVVDLRGVTRASSQASVVRL